jgi:endonuclease-3
MSITNRTANIEKLSKTLKKYYTFNPIAADRSVLDLMLYACCLENSQYDAADEAFAKLQQSYHDLNEVRVTTVAELKDDIFSGLSNPGEVATRVKQTLHSMYETRYSFDLEEMRKGNLGKAVAEMEKWEGTTPYMISFVTQHALGGHSIPLSKSALHFFIIAEMLTPVEAEKKQVPGLERTIAKSKGPEFASLLHQFITEWQSSPKSPTVLTIFKALGVDAQSAAPPKPKATPKKTATKKTTTTKKSSGKDDGVKTTTKSTTTKKTPKKPAAAKKTPAKKAAPKAKAATKKTTTTKTVAKKTSKSSSTINRKKPR